MSDDADITHYLTIDVEDWYLAHLEFFADATAGYNDRPDESVNAAVEKTLDLLDETRNTATFFVQGTVAEHYPEIVQEIAARGHEIGSHGYLHRRLMHLSPDEFERDVRLSLEKLAQAGATEIMGYRAPCFSITRKTMWAVDILQKLGLVYDSSIFPVRRKLYGIPDWPPEPTRHEHGLWEFPPATAKLLGMNMAIAGGGWLRMLPYSFIAGQIQRSNTPRVFYFHPYELDPTGVKLRHRSKKIYTRAVTRLEQMGIEANPKKIRQLLAEFKFRQLAAHPVLSE